MCFEDRVDIGAFTCTDVGRYVLIESGWLIVVFYYCTYLAEAEDALSAVS